MSAGADYDQVLAAIVIDVNEKCAGCIFEDAQTGCFRNVFERSVASIPIETVGEAGGLTNIQIVETVVVDVPDCDSVVPVDVNAARAIEHGAPVVRSPQQLRRVGRIAAESLRRDVYKDGAEGAAAGLVECLPALQAKLAR